MDTERLTKLRTSLSGPIVALTTPMDPTGEVDLDGLEQLVRYYLDPIGQPPGCPCNLSVVMSNPIPYGLLTTPPGWHRLHRIS